MALDLKAKENNLSASALDIARLSKLAEGNSSPLSEGRSFPVDLPLQNQMLQLSTQEQLMLLEEKKLDLERITKETNALKADLQRWTSLASKAEERLKRLESVKDIIALNEFDKASEDFTNARSERDQLESRISSMDTQKMQLESQIKSMQAKFKLETLRELSNKKIQYRSLHAETEIAAQRCSLQVIRSPIDGYVGKLLIHTVGGVVTPAQQVVSVVPFNVPLIAKAMVMNKDIGPIRENLPAVIKVEAFDFQKYGTITGKVTHISNESIKHETYGMIYEVYVDLQETSLRSGKNVVSVGPGMNLIVEISIGKRTVLELFFNPILKVWDEGTNVR
jgi:hemolysin D